MAEELAAALINILKGTPPEDRIELITHPHPRQQWRGLSGYTPVIEQEAMGGAGSGTAVDYTGSGVLMTINQDGDTITSTITIDGAVVLNNKSLPVGNMTLLVGFDSSLKIEWVNGGAAATMIVVYLHD